MSMKHTFVAATTAGLIAGSLVAPQAQAVHAVADGNYCKITYTKEEQNRYPTLASSERISKAELSDAIPMGKQTVDEFKQQRKALAGAGAPAENLKELDNQIALLEGTLKVMESALAQCNGTAAPNPKPGKDDPAPDKGVPAPEGDGGSSSGEGEGDEGEGKNALSTEDGKLNGAGIGVVVAGVLVVLLGGIAAALPALKPMLPANISAMLP